MDVDALVAGVESGQKRAIARLISLMEREDRAGLEAMRRLHGRTGRAHVIGITGSPGTGKSTLTDRLIEAYRRAGKTVGVLAVDPSSPFTGGAILGDRIRMQSRSGDPDVFIRSMGTRGALGGLSTHTFDAVKVLDAAGKDVILVETVGVGQAEVDVVKLADTVAVVLVPNLGDDVQAVKAGIMEIADLFIVNKSDLMGADKVYAEVEASLGLAHPEEDDWFPPICRTIAERGEGVDDVLATVQAHATWSQKTGAWETRRRRRILQEVRRHMERDVARFAFDGQDVRAQFAELVAQAEAGEMSPHDVAHAILGQYKQ